MSITSKENLLKLINEESDIAPALTLDDVDISLPEVVSVNGRDSVVTLTTKIPEDDSEPFEVWYHRRNLPDYLEGDLTFGNEDVATLHDLLPAINERFNINILPDDVEDTPPDGDALTITAVLTSHEWRGAVTLQLINTVQLADVITQTTLDGLVYPDHQVTTVGQASLYSYGLDATSLASWIPSLNAGTADTSAFAKAFSLIVPELWVASDEAKPYNLQGATVEYYGPTAENVGTNPEFTNVLGLKLGALCTNFQGILNLHFNN